MPDIVWLTPDGHNMTPEDWDSGFGRAIGMFLNGDGIRGQDSRGQRIQDANMLVYFNAHDDVVPCTLPNDDHSPEWEIIVDTAGVAADSPNVKAGEVLSVEGRSVVVLRACDQADPVIDHSVAASLAAIANDTTAGG